ncbi:MAG: ATP-dependent DNA helicase RecG [Veillonellaceae bacterium]|nr:ATP-dependent DNA helicase RecG [Veillonellaceae bacterium]
MEEALQTIKGVGPGRERQLHKLGITSVSALLTYFPREYEDRSKVVPIAQLEAGQMLSVVGQVVHVAEKRPRLRLWILEVQVSDGLGRLKLVFFNQRHKKAQFRMGQRVFAYGKVERGYGMWQMNSPQVDFLAKEEVIHPSIVPVYPLVEGVSQFVVRQSVANWLTAHAELPSIIPDGVSRKSSLSRYEAVKEMHFPTSSKRQEEARQQLAYEELFIMQTGLLLLRAQEQGGQAPQMEADGRLVKAFLQSIPFQLTGDQEKAYQEIALDMQAKRPMQRLLQGDVGSGKTIVAFLSLLKAVENGYQGALMVPTEILAKQHRESFEDLCGGLGLKVVLLVGSTKKKEKEAIYQGLAEGTIDIVIGTHALLQDMVDFKRLGLVVIDEQHRFGVEQRASLQRKGISPHVLLMTATPIPRTVTLSVYGDLEISLIKEMPPGRKPVKTYAVDSSYEERLLTFFAKEMAQHHQVYVVCPLVEESETLDLAAAEELYEKLKVRYKNQYEVGLVHGRMKTQEKEAVMTAFHEGRIQLLVSTTVIEVGVNVPNATIMCVVGAERFGLSQLHQLRGRVGRGQAQAYCILVSDSKGSEARQRLHIMETTQDGFKLAEEDLLIRGTGQLFGTMQHGLADLRVADIIKDLPLMVEARADAKRYIKRVGLAEAKVAMEGELRNRFGAAFVRVLYA